MSVSFVDVCTFEEVGTTSKLYRLALRGKAHHHPALPGFWAHHLVDFMDNLDAEVQYHLLKSIVGRKNNAQHEDCELLFHLGHNEGYSLGRQHYR